MSTYKSLALNSIGRKIVFSKNRMIALSMLIIILGGVFWIGHLRDLSRRWNSIGGTIGWDESILLGPRRIQFGVAPGIRTEKDSSEVNRMIRLMCRLPLCKSLLINMGVFADDSMSITELLDRVVVTDLALVAYSGDLSALKLAVRNCKCSNLILIDSVLTTQQMDELMDGMDGVNIKCVSRRNASQAS